MKQELWQQPENTLVGPFSLFKIYLEIFVSSVYHANIVTLIPSYNIPDSKIRWANMGPTWDREVPGGPYDGHTNLAIWDVKASAKWPKFCAHCFRIYVLYRILSVIEDFVLMVIPVSNKEFIVTKAMDNGSGSDAFHHSNVLHLLDCPVINTHPADTRRKNNVIHCDVKTTS